MIIPLIILHIVLIPINYFLLRFHWYKLEKFTIDMFGSPIRRIETSIILLGGIISTMVIIGNIAIWCVKTILVKFFNLPKEHLDKWL